MIIQKRTDYKYSLVRAVVRWLLHLCRINGVCKHFQSFRTIVYQFLSTQFHFYQCVCSVSAMQYRVALQSRTIAIMIQSSIK